jgi:hypothetical protein
MATSLDDNEVPAYKLRAQQRSKVVAAGDRFKLREDENFIRVLPTPAGADGEDAVFAEIYMHSDVGPDSKYVRCGKDAVTKDGDCWICDHLIPRLTLNGNSESAGKLRPRWSLVLQVLALDTDNRPTGPHFWAVSGNLGKDIFYLLAKGKRDYASATRGYFFSVTRTGQGLKTKYSAPIPDDEPSQIKSKYVEMLKPFEQLTELSRYSEKVQKSAWSGDKGQDAESPSSPSSRRGRGGVLDDADETPRRRVVHDDDEAPAAWPGKNRAAPDDEDEAPTPRKHQQQADEDEDAPTPRKRQQSASDDEPEDTPVRVRKARAAVADEGADAAEDAPEPRRPVQNVRVSRSQAVGPEVDETPVRSSKPKQQAVEPEDADEDLPPAPRSTRQAAAQEPVRAPAKAAKKTAAPPEDLEDDDNPFGDD